MSTKGLRYVFIELEDLKTIRFEKLEQIASNVYIFVDIDETNIPFKLVAKLQTMGESLQWVPVENAKSKSQHIAFVLGQMNELLDEKIEFAIISDNDSHDPLINFINGLGRSCIRVKIQSDSNDETFGDNQNAQSFTPPKQSKTITKQEIVEDDEIEVDISDLGVLIEETARDTVKRLIRSGNRPSEVSLLKSYILLHHHDLPVHDNIDKIIDHLKINNEIEIKDDEIIYNF